MTKTIPKCFWCKQDIRMHSEYDAYFGYEIEKNKLLCYTCAKKITKIMGCKK